MEDEQLFSLTLTQLSDRERESGRMTEEEMEAETSEIKAAREIKSQKGEKNILKRRGEDW